MNVHSWQRIGNVAYELALSVNHTSTQPNILTRSGMPSQPRCGDGPYRRRSLAKSTNSTPVIPDVKSCFSSPVNCFEPSAAAEAQFLPLFTLGSNSKLSDGPRVGVVGTVCIQRRQVIGGNSRLSYLEYLCSPIGKLYDRSTLEDAEKISAKKKGCG
jgi:hypothetical protein